ncbi:MAG: ATP-dependent zinc metalloprotease FtsH [Fimbriimonadaceae bacterium]|nr:ATP-dependent zinc metalloprotease FtsH [Fimbriimonadaceae bacterium]
MDVIRELEVLVRAKYSVLYLNTWEESRVEDALKDICTKLNRKLYVWSVTQGMKPALASANRPGPALPGELEALAQVHEGPEFAVFLLKDFHAYMKDYRVVRLLRDLSSRLRGRAQTLILCAPTLNLPVELEKDVTVIDFPLPGRQDIEEMVDLALKATESQGVTAPEPEERELIVKSAYGLTMHEIESSFARSLVEKKKLDVETLLEEKKQIVRKSGLLEFYPAEAKLADVGGMDLLKDWLNKRQEAFTDKAKDFGIPAPKGILLLGVQGCGKSLLAKAIAATWNLPMLKMDIGRIFGSLVGQSEENIRRAIRIAESVSPCCLWADELEKGFAGIGSSGVSDSGTTMRVFATFLTWMQEKTRPVFIIATANDVTALPPELLRKGRFDEIFFVDLPDREEREDIFRIHLSKRKRDPANYDIPEIAKLTKGFSGAEIEQVVVGALYYAFDAGRELNMDDLKKEADQLVPLSVMMAEDIDELRDWARMRTRPSSTQDGD